MLDFLKEEVLKVGATEEEFNEALRQITLNGVPDFVLAQKEKPTKIVFKNIQATNYKQIIKEYLEEKTDIALEIIKSKHIHIGSRKKILAFASLAIILIVFVPGLLGKQINNSQNVKLANPVPSVNPKSNSVATIPIVYANLQPVDADKIFSIKSTNIQLVVSGKPKKEVLGFFPYWMVSKQDQINLSTLTSISLFGLETDGNGNIITSDGSGVQNSGWSMWTDPAIDKFIKKAKAQGLKVYLTIKSFDNSNIEKISNNDDSQKALIANAVYLVNSKNMDGINIDFEYTGQSSDNLRNGFTRFITNLNTELKRQVPNSVLTIDTYLVSGSEKGLFDLTLLSQNSDAFVVMGYDMHTPLGAPGPISAMGGDTNIVGYIQNYLEQVDAGKLILAVPYYGYDWPQNSATGSASDVKILPYAEIADASKNLQLSWDDTSETPYFTYKDDSGSQRIVHFDNVRSLGIKYDYINRKNLRGVGIWALGYDGQNQDLEKLLIDKFINQ